MVCGLQEARLVQETVRMPTRIFPMRGLQERQVGMNGRQDPPRVESLRASR